MKTQDNLKSPIFKTIIAGVDFSSYSKLVAKQAKKLAHDLHAHLVLVYAVIEPWQLTNPEVYAFAAVTVPTVEVETNGIEGELRKFYKLKPLVEVVVLEGNPHKVLSQVADSHPAPLIVIGSRGAGTFSRFILGSNAEQIALNSSSPVWVHRGTRVVSFDRILVPMDLSKNALRVVDLFRKWSSQQKLKHSFLFVRPEVPPHFDSPQFRKSFGTIYQGVLKTLKEFKKSHVNAPLITTAGEPAERICHVGQRFNAVAMNPHNRSEILGTFGKVTTKVIRQSKIPVLVLKTDGA